LPTGCTTKFKREFAAGFAKKSKAGLITWSTAGFEAGFATGSSVLAQIELKELPSHRLPHPKREERKKKKKARTDTSENSCDVPQLRARRCPLLMASRSSCPVREGISRPQNLCSSRGRFSVRDPAVLQRCGTFFDQHAGVDLPCLGDFPDPRNCDEGGRHAVADILKAAFLMWLYLPQTAGAHYVYTTFLRPYLRSQSTFLDSTAAKAREKVSSMSQAALKELDAAQKE
ncbi:MAG: hypothetical protein BJ554DRAFT_6261, partial [Olpidium bornovanus]